MLNKKCIICRKEFVVASNRKRARFCSIKCKAIWQRDMPKVQRKKISETLKRKGIVPPSRFKSDSKNYSTIHKWLVKKFGKATYCTGKHCTGKSKNYQYALIHGKEYSRNIKDYKQLCASCHRKYDMTDAIKLIIIKNLTWNTISQKKTAKK